MKRVLKHPGEHGKKLAVIHKVNVMKKLLVIAIAGLLGACNNNNTNEDESGSADRPREVNEAVTNSTKIVNDSVIVPDTNNTGINPSETDTSGKRMD